MLLGCVQNLGEAELVVSCYQYMRLRGYPADRISILTTYNGQKALLRDVIEQRCARHPAFGRPSKVAGLPHPKTPWPHHALFPHLLHLEKKKEGGRSCWYGLAGHGMVKRLKRGGSWV